jgi:hypothetical protein
VGATDTDVRFSRIVVAFPNDPVVVITGLVEPTGSEVTQPQPTRPETPKVVVEHPPWALHTGVGVAASFGADPDGPETGTKLAVPIEAGVVWHPINAVWTRVALAGGPLLTGVYGWSDGDVATSSPSLLGAHLAGGFAASQGELGLLAGYQWPGRVAVRGVLAAHVPKVPARLEARIGLNAPTGATPETALDVLVELTPRLVRRRAPDEDADG